jgi:hypothetical protein
MSDMSAMQFSIQSGFTQSGAKSSKGDLEQMKQHDE